MRRVVVDHVLLVVRDLEASRRFYRGRPGAPWDR
jgi:catechol 2,3-dioxygenase-like lactoylglutathione lyase family enzyme